MPQPSAPPYVISARTQEGIIQRTRTVAASAVVLACSWREAGYEEVEVIEPSGRVLTPEAYRGRMLRERERRW